MTKRETRRNRRKRGGAFVRKGSYGCAFAKPPLKCRGEAARRPANELSKLLEYKKAQEEYQESVPFQRIDPDKRYFLWAHHICPLDTKDVLPENRIEKCVQPNRGQAEPTVNVRRDPTLIFYDFGGRDISDIVITSGQYGPFLLSLGNLLEGLGVMHYNHIAHMDIKPMNIVSMELPTGEFSTRFIDFGLAVSTERGTSTNPRILGLSPQNYPWWPFDFRFLSRTEVRVIPSELNRWYNQLSGMQSYLPQSSYWNPDWTPKYNSAKTQELMNAVQWNYREEILQKLDVYALGISFAEVFATKTHHYMRTYGDADVVVVQLNNRTVVPFLQLNASHFGGDEEIAEWHRQFAKTVSGPMYFLIKYMTNMSPKLRLSANDAAEIFATRLMKGIVDFFFKYDAITQKALAAVGVRVMYSKLKLQPTPPTTMPPMPTATAPKVTAAAPPLPPSAPSSATKPIGLESLLKQAQEVLGTSAPKTAEKSGTTAASDPAITAIAPVSNLRARTFGKQAATFPKTAGLTQPMLPGRAISANRGIAGPQHTGVNVLRKLAGVPQQPQVQANPFYVPQNAKAKKNTTRKFRFPWEKK